MFTFLGVLFLVWLFLPSPNTVTVTQVFLPKGRDDE